MPNFEIIFQKNLDGNVYNCNTGVLASRYNLWYDRNKLKGVLARAEIIPSEPDPGNAGVGSKWKNPLFRGFFC